MEQTVAKINCIRPLINYGQRVQQSAEYEEQSLRSSLRFVSNELKKNINDRQSAKTFDWKRTIIDLGFDGTFAHDKLTLD